MGWTSIIVVPETQAKEKLDYLRMIGADLRLVQPKPFSDPGSYVHVSRRLAEDDFDHWSDTVGAIIEIFVDMHRTVPGFRVLRFGDVADVNLLDAAADELVSHLVRLGTDVRVERRVLRAA